MDYVSGGESGVTDAEGAFTYEQGSTVTFSVGGVTLGSGTGQAVMTPLNLVASSSLETDAVVNLTRFLMLLDEDETPANGITIGSAVRTAAEGWSAVDFSSASFDTDVASIVSDVGTAYGSSPSLVGATTAANHLSYTYGCVASGVYAGTFTGDQSGTALMWVDSILYDPNLLGTFDPVQGVAYAAFYNTTNPEGLWSNVDGALSVNSDHSIAVGSSAALLQLTGTVEAFNSVSGGAWSSGAESGSFSVTRLAGASDAVYRITGYYTLKGGAGADTLGALALDVAADSNVTGKLAISDGTTVDVSGSLSGAVITVSGNGYGFSLDLDVDGSNTSNDSLLGDVPGVTGSSSFSDQTGSVIGSVCLLNYTSGLVSSIFTPPLIPVDNVSQIDYATVTGLEGVYQGSVARTGGCEVEDDVNLFVVAADGSVRYFDYMGDACNAGSACYTEPTAPNYTPSAIRMGAGGGIEATFIGHTSDWLSVVFAKGDKYPGVSFSSSEAITGGFDADTEQSFGIKTRAVTLAEIEANICP